MQTMTANAAPAPSLHQVAMRDDVRLSTDLYLPPGVAPVVVEGQTMVGGETVLAELGP